MNYTMFFEYRGYATHCTIEIPQHLVDKAVQDKIDYHEKIFEDGYDLMFDEYKRKWNKGAVKNRTVIPEELR